MSTAQDFTADSVKTDKGFARLCLAIAVVIPFACGMLLSYSASMLLIMMVTVAPLWSLAVLILLAVSAINAIERRWRISLRCFGASVIMTGSLILAPIGLKAGYHFRLWSFRSYYDAEIDQIPKDSGPRVRVFDWGGYLTVNSIFLVYDEGDQVSLPAGTQSPEWKVRANDRTGGLFGRDWSGEHLRGHYYVVTTY
jgi:hypothetical protein